MKHKKNSIFNSNCSLIVTIFFFTCISYSQNQCENLFNQAQNNQPPVFEMIPYNLLQYYQETIVYKDFAQVMLENGQLISAYQNYAPVQTSPQRASAVSYRIAKKALQHTEDHPVIGRDHVEKYQKPDRKIGYCFGRSMYLHLLLLKMGVQKDSIRKIWSVGPSRTNMPGIIWDFHVATMVYSHDRGWLVLDTNFNEPQMLNEWTRQMLEHSVDDKLKFYITEAERMGAIVGKYDPYQLGLKVSRENDFFSHYFVDMLRYLKKEDVSRLNVKPKINIENSNEEMTMTSLLKDLKSVFGF